MKFHIFIAIFALIFLSGCRFFWEAKPQKNTLKKEQIKPKIEPKQAIKGVISELSYQDELYCYTIIATDTTNYKLKSANFCLPKFLHSKGDLVYATFSAKRLESMLLIKEANTKTAIKRKNRPTKTDITPAKEIKINFD